MSSGEETGRKVLCQKSKRNPLINYITLHFRLFKRFQNNFYLFIGSRGCDSFESVELHISRIVCIRKKGCNDAFLFHCQNFFAFWGERLLWGFCSLWHSPRRSGFEWMNEWLRPGAEPNGEDENCSLGMKSSHTFASNFKNDFPAEVCCFAVYTK